jgi:hypothetical protein
MLTSTSYVKLFCCNCKRRLDVLQIIVNQVDGATTAASYVSSHHRVERILTEICHLLPRVKLIFKVKF